MEWRDGKLSSSQVTRRTSMFLWLTDYGLGIALKTGRKFITTPSFEEIKRLIYEFNKTGT
jgi:hypothetical protein